MSERRDVQVHSETAVAYFSASARNMLYDPERPAVDADQLMRELGGMLDPRLVNHNCPVCHKTMRWELFVAHAEPCMRRWFKTLDVMHRSFPGAALERKDVAIGAVAATADAGTS